jgi:hypothetical protein
MKQNWGEDRVMFRDETGALRSVPLSWTDLAPPDPFVTAAAGRVVFHATDLGRLADLLHALREGAGEV